MRYFIIFIVAAATATAQLSVPQQTIKFPNNSCGLEDNDVVQTRVRIASTAGTVQFRTFTDPSRWLRVTPLTGTVTQAGAELTLTVDKSRASKGYQETWFAVQVGNTAFVLYAGVDCVPSPTLKIPEESLDFTAIEGGEIRQGQFTVQHNNQTQGPVDFAIEWETPGYNIPWIVSAQQPGQLTGRGLVTETNPARITVRVDPRNANVGTWSGLVHVRDVDGSDSIRVNLRVDPRPATIFVPTQPLMFTSQGGAATPASRPLPVSSTGTSVSFTARPLTSSGGGWLRLNNGTTPVMLATTTDLTVSVAPGNLAPGNYAGSIEVAQTSGGNLAFTVPVQLTVLQVEDTTPSILQNGVREAAGGAGVISAGAWASIYGVRLAPSTVEPAGRLWRTSEIVNGRFPLTLDGVSVTIGGRSAPVYFVSNGQINVQVPPDTGLGNNVPVVVTTSRGLSQTAVAVVQQVSPGLFLFAPSRHVAAQHADFTSVGPPNLLQGGTFTPARVGEVILIYGTGFGPTNPLTAVGEIINGGARVNAPVRVTIGGVEAPAQAFISGAGLYQLNVTIPLTLSEGDHQVVAEIGGVRTQADALLRVIR